MEIPNAAYEAGKRRLRPIFLTAMAAATSAYLYSQNKWKKVISRLNSRKQNSMMLKVQLRQEKQQNQVYTGYLQVPRMKKADLLSAKASMAKAESDYYAAQMNYRIALSELKILTGNY